LCVCMDQINPSIYEYHWKEKHFSSYVDVFWAKFKSGRNNFYSFFSCLKTGKEKRNVGKSYFVVSANKFLDLGLNLFYLPRKHVYGQEKFLYFLSSRTKQQQQQQRHYEFESKLCFFPFLRREGEKR
jgi:hypothetical protein